MTNFCKCNERFGDCIARFHPCCENSFAYNEAKLTVNEVAAMFVEKTIAKESFTAQEMGEFIRLFLQV